MKSSVYLRGNWWNKQHLLNSAEEQVKVRLVIVHLFTHLRQIKSL